jgi:hypothetical protein
VRADGRFELRGRNADLLDREELDVGYRLLVAERHGTGVTQS